MEHQRALPAGTRIEEYQLETVLGTGGFGITYRAHDTNLDKAVAIKEYLPGEFAMRTADSTVVPNSDADAADYAWGLARFLDEARTLARFDHPHLNKVYRFFEANGTAYLVLDYVEGEPLSARLRQQKTLPAEELERLLTDVLSGLEAVHVAGYVHRDVKPGNLMVRPDGSTVLLDFGAARQAIGQRSKSVTAILTPGYAPIEQYDSKAEDVGPWSDLYALGMVAYRCVSGLPDGELPDAVTRSRNARKGLPDLSPAIEVGIGRYAPKLLAAIDHAIQVNEDERPQSVAAWRRNYSGQQNGPLAEGVRNPKTKRDEIDASNLGRAIYASSPPLPLSTDSSGQERDPNLINRPRKVKTAIKLLYLSVGMEVGIAVLVGDIGGVRDLRIPFSCVLPALFFFIITNSTGNEAIMTIPCALFLGFLTNMTGKGKNWACITLSILSISAVVLLAVVLAVGVVTIGHPKGPAFAWSLAIGVPLLRMIAVVLLFQKPSFDWFRHLKTANTR